MPLYTPISQLLERIKKDIIQQYYSKGLKASGSFEKNMTIGRQGRYKTVLTLPNYSQFIMKFKGNTLGRGKGGFPPVAAIEQWIKDKGIPLRDLGSGRFATKTSTKIKQVAYLIGRKIAEKGTDIHLRKRQPIDLDVIVNDQLDYAGEEIADRILQELKL